MGQGRGTCQQQQRILSQLMSSRTLISAILHTTHAGCKRSTGTTFMAQGHDLLNPEAVQQTAQLQSQGQEPPLSLASSLTVLSAWNLILNELYDDQELAGPLTCLWYSHCILHPKHEGKVGALQGPKLPTHRLSLIPGLPGMSRGAVCPQVCRRSGRMKVPPPIHLILPPLGSNMQPTLAHVWPLGDLSN